MANPRFLTNPRLQAMPENQHDWSRFMQELALYIESADEIALRDLANLSPDSALSADNHKRLYSRWDDLRFPSQGINPPGAVTDPDLESTTGLWLFAAAGTETLAGIAQMPHAWKQGTDISPHVHWQKTTSASGNVYWQLDYEIVNNGDTATMAYGTTLSTTSAVAGTPDTDTANKVLISSFGTIDMSAYDISCLVVWKLSRIGGDAADTYGADARLLEFDIHYQSDSLGSVALYEK